MYEIKSKDENSPLLFIADDELSNKIKTLLTQYMEIKVLNIDPKKADFKPPLLVTKHGTLTKQELEDIFERKDDLIKIVRTLQY